MTGIERHPSKSTHFMRDAVDAAIREGLTPAQRDILDQLQNYRGPIAITRPRGRSLREMADARAAFAQVFAAVSKRFTHRARLKALGEGVARMNGAWPLPVRTVVIPPGGLIITVPSKPAKPRRKGRLSPYFKDDPSFYPNPPRGKP